MSGRKADRSFGEQIDVWGEELARFLFLLAADPLDAEDLLLEIAAEPPRSGGEEPPALAAHRVAFARLRARVQREKRSPFHPVDLVTGREGSPARAARLREAWMRVPLGERAAAALLVGMAWGRGEVARILAVPPKRVWGSAEKALLVFQREIDGRSRQAALPKGWERGEMLARILSDPAFAREGDDATGGRMRADLVAAMRSLRLVRKSVLRGAVWRRIRKRMIRELPGDGGELLLDTFDTPLGPFQVALHEGVVVGTAFGRRRAAEWARFASPRHAFDVHTDRSVPDRPRRELLEYFAGTRRRFTFPYRLFSVTSFRAAVLDACARVPFGSVRSYRQIAEAAGHPGSWRAVGGALGKNPLPVVIPCHRVISHDGHMGGFSAGITLKERLLALEGLGDLFVSAR